MKSLFKSFLGGKENVPKEEEILPKARREDTATSVASGSTILLARKLNEYKYKSELREHLEKAIDRTKEERVSGSVVARSVSPGF